MPKKRRRRGARGPATPMPPQQSSRQTAVRRCLKMLEVCFPRAFVPRGSRSAWTVPLHDDVWQAIYPLVVHEWGYDDATFYGVRSEYTHEMAYWEAVMRIGIRGGLDGLPGTLDGLHAYLAERSDVLVTSDDRRAVKKKIVRWAKHHYPKPGHSKPGPAQPEPVPSTTRKRSSAEPAVPVRPRRPEPPERKRLNQKPATPATNTSLEQPASPPDKPLEQREKRRQGVGPQPSVLVKKHRQVVVPPEAPAPDAEAPPAPAAGRKPLSLKPKKPPDQA